MRNLAVGRLGVGILIQFAFADLDICVRQHFGSHKLGTGETNRTGSR